MLRCNFGDSRLRGRTPTSRVGNDQYVMARKAESPDQDYHSDGLMACWPFGLIRFQNKYQAGFNPRSFCFAEHRDLSTMYQYTTCESKIFNKTKEPVPFMVPESLGTGFPDPATDTLTPEQMTELVLAIGVDRKDLVNCLLALCNKKFERHEDEEMFYNYDALFGWKTLAQLVRELANEMTPHFCRQTAYKIIYHLPQLEPVFDALFIREKQSEIESEWNAASE